MTISTYNTPAANLGARLARRARAIIRIDAIVTTLAGLEMTLLPALFIRLHGLGSTPESGLRLLGLVWLLFGLWLLSLWNRPLTAGMAIFAMAVLGINGAFILVAPLVFDLGLTGWGWALLIGTLAFMDLVCLTWWQVLRGRPAHEA